MGVILEWEQRPVEVRETENPANQCTPGDVVFYLAGRDRTDATGEWHLKVQPNLCFAGGILQPISLVATASFPREERPRAVFCTTEYVENAGFPVIGVRTWRHDGTPAKDIPFAWHLAVLSTFVA